MKKVSKRLIVALMLAAVLALVVTGTAMAAGPNDGVCPNDGICQNDGVCPYDGEGPADGTGLQKRAKAGTDAAVRNQSCTQLNADGTCAAKQFSRAWRHGNKLTAE